MRALVPLIVVVVVLVVGVAYAMVARLGQAPMPTATVTEDIRLEESPGSGQFLQVAPTTLPPNVTDEDLDLSNDTIDTMPPEEAVVPVSITEQGFSKTALTISVGTTVRFINDGQSEHWPASDPHPTHTILPDFDSKRGLQTGETFEYTFTQAGTWPFHDHLNPRAQGTITVE